MKVKARSGKRIKNHLIGVLQGRFRFPIDFSLEKCLTAELQPYDGTLRNKNSTTFSVFGACIASMNFANRYLVPHIKEPPLGRLTERRYMLNNMRWDLGISHILRLEQAEKSASTPEERDQVRLDVIKFLLDTKYIEINDVNDRAVGVDLGLIKMDIPTFDDEEEE